MSITSWFKSSLFNDAPDPRIARGSRFHFFSLLQLLADLKVMPKDKHGYAVFPNPTEIEEYIARMKSR